MNPTDWPSLTSQIDLANRLFGPRGAKLLNAWFAEQIGRINDPAFARLFSDHIDLPGVERGDYNHRLVHTSHGTFLGGIRFYGHDLARPFVEIIAHDFENWSALRDCVATEWSTFAPRLLRTLVLPGATLPQETRIDMTIFAAHYAEMTPPDGSVALIPFAHVEDAIAMVTARYEALSQDQPALARNISAADPHDLRRWHEQDEIRAISIEVDGTSETVGLLAAAPGAVEWIEGDEVYEEVVATPYRARSFAASAQKAGPLGPTSIPVACSSAQSTAETSPPANPLCEPGAARC